MTQAKSFSRQSFLILLASNSLLGGGLYYFGNRALETLRIWINQPMDAGPDTVAVTVQNIISYLNDFIPQSSERLLWYTLALVLAATLLGWFLLKPLTARLAAASGGAAAKPQRIEVHSPAPAIQLLALFQRHGRLLDFLEEDLSSYDDAQIGAAVRNVHQGCRKALDDHFQLKPVMREAEGSEVTIPRGFDARQIRLTGNVVGDPPFNGALRHKGWKVQKVELPEQTAEQSNSQVIAAAEVEVK